MFRKKKNEAIVAQSSDVPSTGSLAGVSRVQPPHLFHLGAHAAPTLCLHVSL